MATCTQCKREIEALIEIVCERVSYRVTLHLDGFLRDSLNSRTERSHEVIHFECPECEAILCSSLEGARSFLARRQKK